MLGLNCREWQGGSDHTSARLCLQELSTLWVLSRPHPGLCLDVWSVRPPSEGTAAASELRVGLEGLKRQVKLPGKGANLSCHMGRAWGAWESPPLVATRAGDLAITRSLAGAQLSWHCTEMRFHSVLPRRLFQDINEISFSHVTVVTKGWRGAAQPE